MELRKLKIVKKKSLGLRKVVDLTVEDVHSYVSENGIINHNSGTKYASTVTLFLSGSKLEDKENDKAAAERVGAGDVKRNGVKVTCTPDKSRLCIPHKVRFQIPFFKEPNPYKGLEDYLNWDNAGIMLGKCYNEEEYKKLKPAEQLECKEFDFNGEKRYAQEKKALTRGVGFVCKHLGRAVDVKDFLSPVCFTPEFMKFINENIIRPEFELPSRDSFADIKELEKELGLDDDDQEG